MYVPSVWHIALSTWVLKALDKPVYRVLTFLKRQERKSSLRVSEMLTSKALTQRPLLPVGLPALVPFYWLNIGSVAGPASANWMWPQVWPLVVTHLQPCEEQTLLGGWEDPTRISTLTNFQTERSQQDLKLFCRTKNLAIYITSGIQRSVWIQCANWQPISRRFCSKWLLFKKKLGLSRHFSRMPVSSKGC